MLRVGNSEKGPKWEKKKNEEKEKEIRIKGWRATQKKKKKNIYMYIGGELSWKTTEKEDRNLSRGPECFLPPPPHAGKSRWENKKRKKMERARERGWCVCVHNHGVWYGRWVGRDNVKVGVKAFQSNRFDPDLFPLTPFMFWLIFSSLNPLFLFSFRRLVHLRFFVDFPRCSNRMRAPYNSQG